MKNRSPIPAPRVRVTESVLHEARPGGWEPEADMGWSRACCPPAGSLMRGSYRIQIFVFLVVSFTQGLFTLNAQVNSKADVIVVDPNAPSHPFPHFWEKMFGSGRAVLTLRDSYRRDLRQVKQVTDFEYVRFHAIFHDEIGLYDEDS